MLLLVRKGLEPEVVAAQRAIFGLRFVHDWNVRGDRKSQSDVRVGPNTLHRVGRALFNLSFPAHGCMGRHSGVKPPAGLPPGSAV